MGLLVELLNNGPPPSLSSRLRVGERGPTRGEPESELFEGATDVGSLADWDELTSERSLFPTALSYISVVPCSER